METTEMEEKDFWEQAMKKTLEDEETTSKGTFILENIDSEKDDEIRNINNPALPAIHAFERWKLVSYQPVQGRLTILNPTGYKETFDESTNSYNIERE